MSAKQVDVAGRKFNVVQAPANKQKTLLSLIGAGIAMRSVASGVEEIDTAMLFGALLSLKEDSFDEVAGIVLYQTVENGGDAVVDVGAFQGQITTYYLLVAEAIKVNLNDFFTYLDNANKETRKVAKKP